MALLLCAGVTHAQYNLSSKKPAEHYLTMGFGGGGMLTFAQYADGAPDVRNSLGADALFQLSYELRKGRFLFGFGVQADYDLAVQRIDSMTHVFDRLDREGDEIYYAYRYQDYTDRQHAVQVSVPLYVGGYITSYLYLLAGAKVSLGMYGTHHTTTMLSTDGTYKRFIHTIENAPTYGYYVQDDYGYKGAYSVPQLAVSPMLEFGARYPIQSKSHRLAMRVGAYVEYNIPLSFTNEAILVDYSHVNQNPAMLSKQDLKDNIVFNPVLNSSYLKKAYSGLSFGLKWTLVINVTPEGHSCMCDNDMQ